MECAERRSAEDLFGQGGTSDLRPTARLIRILQGDVFACLARLDDDSVDCVVTSPPYWGLRDYGVEGQIGLERSLGEHLDVMVRVFREVRRVLKPSGTLWLNYGDCYATSPNGRSAADTKAAGNDDRTFRDKPFSTVGPIYGAKPGKPMEAANGTGRRGGGNNPAGAIYQADHESGDRRGKSGNKGSAGQQSHTGRVVSGGTLKPKDLCMVPNRLAIALQDDGWWVRSEIVWGKTNPMPDSSGRYRPSTAHEKIFLLTKTGKSFYDPMAVVMPLAKASVQRLGQDVAAQRGSDRANAGGKTNGRMKAVKFGGNKGQGEHGSAARPASGNEWKPNADVRLLRNYEAALDVWPMATEAFKDAHFATFPPELVERCLKAGCPKGGTVLDPFGGSGTTGLVADGLGMDSVLIELNPAYVEIARKRLGDMFREIDVEVVT